MSMKKLWKHTYQLVKVNYSAWWEKKEKNEKRREERERGTKG